MDGALIPPEHLAVQVAIGDGRVHARGASPSCTTHAEGMTLVTDAETAPMVSDEPLSPPGHTVEQVMGTTEARSKSCEADAALAEVELE